MNHWRMEIRVFCIMHSLGDCDGRVDASPQRAGVEARGPEVGEHAAGLELASQQNSRMPSLTLANLCQAGVGILGILRDEFLQAISIGAGSSLWHARDVGAHIKDRTWPALLELIVGGMPVPHDENKLDTTLVEAFESLFDRLPRGALNGSDVPDISWDLLRRSVAWPPIILT